MGGFGTGLINVSSIVAVNKYFDAKREIATGMKMFVVNWVKSLEIIDATSSFHRDRRLWKWIWCISDSYYD